jgi:hypothetical protein
MAEIRAEVDNISVVADFGKHWALRIAYPAKSVFMHYPSSLG